MELKVNEMTPAAAVDTAVKPQAAEGDFKFTLTSAIDEAGLAERLNTLLDEITNQGERIAQPDYGYPGYEKIPWAGEGFFE